MTTMTMMTTTTWRSERAPRLTITPLPRSIWGSQHRSASDLIPFECQEA